MRRLPLTFTVALAVLGCSDDVPQDPTGTSTGTGSDETTTSSGPTVDPSATSEVTTTSVDSSSGPGIQCGNGQIEEGEQCDDANEANDDDCYDTCVIPYEVLWTETYDGGPGDFADTPLFDADGNLYVFGQTVVMDRGRDLWLRQYLPDGSEGWTWTYNGPANGDEFARDMDWHQSGDLLLVGSTETDTEDDILVIRLGIDDQVPVWVNVYDGPGMGPDPLDDTDFGDGIAGAANGDVLVAGSERVDGEEHNMWLRRYDGDGNELWTQTYGHAFNGGDQSDDVVEDSAGNLYWLGFTEVAQNDREAFVRKLDSDGNELWTQQLADIDIFDAQIDPMDNLVLAGLTFDSGLDIWVARYDPDFAPLESTEYDGPSSEFDLARSVALDDAGDVYVGGFITIIGEQSNTWVARYEPSLQLRFWADSYSNDDTLLSDELLGVAVTPDGSRVAAVGYETVQGQGENAWIRVIQSNPRPR